MHNIQQMKYNDSQIEFEVINGQVFANATAMCKAFGKKPINWLRSVQTERYINAIKAKCENLTLVETRQGGDNSGTWIHEKLILKLAQWLSVDFEIWCDEKIAELLRNGEAKKSPQSDYHQLSQHTQRPTQLQSSKVANSFAFKRLNGKQDAIDWNRKVTFTLTGKTPSELKDIAKKHNLPSKYRTSGKEVVRYYKPEVAGAISLADWLHANGETDDKALSLSKMAIPVLEAINKHTNLLQ